MSAHSRVLPISERWFLSDPPGASASITRLTWFWLNFIEPLAGQVIHHVQTVYDVN